MPEPNNSSKRPHLQDRIAAIFSTMPAVDAAAPDEAAPADEPLPEPDAAAEPTDVQQPHPSADEQASDAAAAAPQVPANEPSASAEEPPPVMAERTEPPAARARHLYLDTAALFEATCQGLSDGAEIDGTPLLRRMEDMIAMMRDDERFLINLTHLPPSYLQKQNVEIAHEETVLYGLNAMIYSLQIGLSLDLAPERLPYLAMSALLQNVGYLSLHPQELPDSTESILQTLASRQGEVEPFLARIYFRGLDATALRAIVHVSTFSETMLTQTYHDNVPMKFATINQLCNLFVHLIHNRRSDDRLSPHHAMRIISRDLRGHFHPSVVKLFLNKVTIYPLGTCLRLANGDYAKVVDTNPRHVMRPVIVVLMDSDRQPTVTRERIDLSHTPNVLIAEALTDDLLTEAFIDVV